MTLVSDIITQAYRESNLLPIGNVPTADQNTEALVRLVVLVSGALGTDVGQKLIDWPIGTANVQGGLNGWSALDWSYPVADSRLVIMAQAATTVYFPANPDDGARMALVDALGQLNIYPATLNANGRKIELAPIYVANFANQTREWLYRADIGNWVAINDITLGGQMPYPDEFDDYFITKLAFRLNPRYGRSADPQTTAILEETRGRLMSRYRQKKVLPADIGVLPRSVQTYNRSLGYSAPKTFRPWMR